MKRILLIVIAICVLFSGCRLSFSLTEPTDPPAAAPTSKVTEATTEAATEPATTPSTELTTEATEPKQETVTIYLLEKTHYYDSGYVEYTYDENYNLVSYQVYTLEKTLMYTTIFEAPDANGMPCTSQTQWPDGSKDDWVLEWFQDGKIKESTLVDSFTGWQYEYDNAGNRTEKRAYYDGELESATYYVYDGSALSQVYTENGQGDRIYDCRLENGIITEKKYSQADGGYIYYYEYDENGNLVNETALCEGEMIPIQSHTYKAVEVAADRAAYLLAQQDYILDIS